MFRRTAPLLLVLPVLLALPAAAEGDRPALPSAPAHAALVFEDGQVRSPRAQQEAAASSVTEVLRRLSSGARSGDLLDLQLGVDVDETPDEEFFGHLQPAGDFDADGAPDVLATSRTRSQDVLRVRGTQGSTGRELWRRDVDRERVYGLTPATVGAQGAAGLVLVGQPEAVPSPTPPALASVHGLALPVEGWGADGRTAWTATVTGRYVQSSDTVLLGTGLPYRVHLGQFLPGAATDVLVSTFDAYKTAEGAVGYRFGARLIDGATGLVTSAPTLAPQQPDALFPELLPVPDVTGDGLDDLAFVELYQALPSTVTALGALDGLPRWRREGLPSGSSVAVEAVGDTNGDRLGELALNLLDDRGNVASAVLLDGGTGDVRLQADDAYVHGLQETSTDGDNTVGLVSFAYEEGPEQLRITSRVLDGAGATLSASSQVLLDAYYGEVVLLGDTNDDGTDDSFLQMYAESAAREFTSLRGMLSGVDGELLWREGNLDDYGVFGTPSLDAGTGADLVTRSYGTNEVRSGLHALDGSSGASLWDYEPEYQGVLELYPVGAQDMNRDGRADLVITDAFVRNAVLDGADGETIWRFAPGNDDTSDY